MTALLLHLYSDVKSLKGVGDNVDKEDCDENDDGGVCARACEPVNE